jgi:hypothetical protein
MPNESSQKDFIDAVVAAIKGAIGTSSAITNKIVDAQIVFAKHPAARGHDATYPACIVSPVPETFGPGTNASYDARYGVRVTLAQSSNGDLTANTDRLLYWREVLMDLFADRRLSGYTDAYLVRVEPGAVLSDATFLANVDASSFIVRAYTRRTNK